ncbi:MAG: metal ABC transporter ATP-binding protein [Actinomycetota bacterium]
MRVTNETAFELSRARVSLGQHVVLDGLDFRLDLGEFVVLLGANGSGKTTLIRALLGLVPLQSGTLRLFGQDRDRFRSWERIGYVPQRFSAVAGVPATVGEVVLSGRLARASWFRPYSAEDRNAVTAALDIVGLAGQARASVGKLSGGQQQRVLIARALASEPEVLVLDEPVSGVDLEHQESFAVTLKTLKDRGRSVLLVAHSIGLMEPLLQRAVVLQGGAIAYDGPPLKQQLAEVYVHHHPHHERHL